MASIDSTFFYTKSDFSTDTIAHKVVTIVPQIKDEIYLKSVEKSDFLNDWSVVLIIIVIAQVASIRVTSGKYIHFLIQSVLNRRTAQRLYRERITNILHPSFRLDILSNLVLGIFLFHFEHYYCDSFIYSELIIFLLNVLVVLVFNISKYLLYRLSGFLFGCQNEISEYVFYLKSSNRIMGLFLSPIAVLLYFQSGIWSEISLFLGVLVILFLSGSSLYKGIRIIEQKDFSIYYMILYLCTLEILPLLIVWRILWIM